MLKGMREYLKRKENLINIFLVYFFLTFVIGYLDFDRRVLTFEQSTGVLERIIQGTEGPPMGRRILVPYIINTVHKIMHMPLKYVYAFFRFIFFFMAFCLFHIYLRLWFDDKMAMIGTLSMIASLPLFLTNWYCIPNDMPDLIFMILGTMWIRENRYKLLYLLIPLATVNKETTAALVLLYFLYNIGRERTAVLIRRTAVCGLLWLIPFTALTAIFGRESFPDFMTLKHNLGGLLYIFKNPNPYNHYYFLLYLCGFYWILAFKDFRRKDPILKRSVIVMLFFFLYAVLGVAAMNETRIFIPFYVFVIPLGLSSLFKNGVGQKT